MEFRDHKSLENEKCQTSTEVDFVCLVPFPQFDAGAKEVRTVGLQHASSSVAVATRATWEHWELSWIATWVTNSGNWLTMRINPNFSQKSNQSNNSGKSGMIGWLASVSIPWVSTVVTVVAGNTPFPMAICATRLLCSTTTSRRQKRRESKRVQIVQLFFGLLLFIILVHADSDQIKGGETWEVFMDEFDQWWYGKKQLPVTGTLLYYLYIFVRCVQGSTAVKIPWEDLRYIFGEIMYGGVLRKNSSFFAMLVVLVDLFLPSCAWRVLEAILWTTGIEECVRSIWVTSCRTGDMDMQRRANGMLNGLHGDETRFETNHFQSGFQKTDLLRRSLSKTSKTSEFFFPPFFFLMEMSCHQDDILDEMELVPYVAHPQFSPICKCFFIETLKLKHLKNWSFDWLLRMRPMDSAGSRQGLGPTRSTSSTSCLTDKTTRQTTHFHFWIFE